MHRKAAWSVLVFIALAACERDVAPEVRAGTAAQHVTARPRIGVAAFASADGAVRMRALGCGGCHAGEGPRTQAVPLAAGEGARDPAALFVYLTDSLPTSPRADGARMPDFHLTDAEALALSLYLGSGRATGDARARFQAARDAHSDIDADDGARVYDALRCGACHSSDPPPPDAPSLGFEGARVQERWLLAFLLQPHAVRPFGSPPGTGARMPEFGLTSEDVAAISGTLAVRTTELAPFEPAAPTAFAAAKMGTLLRERYDCLGCHAWNGEGGRIAPDLAVAGERLRPAYIRAMLDRPHELAPGTMMPVSRLPAAERDELAAFIATYAAGADTSSRYLSLLDDAIAKTTATATAMGNAPSGASIYRHRCAACHGLAGGGDGFNAAYLDAPPTAHANGESMSRRPDDTLYDGIAAGGRILGRSARMPAFGASLTPDEIRALVAHIRDLCDCAPPAWSADGSE